MYKEDMALSNLFGLICHKIQPIKLNLLPQSCVCQLETVHHLRSIVKDKLFYYL